MTQMFECEMDGIKYVWNGKMWYEDDKYMELPMRITNRLNILMNATSTDYKTLSIDEVMRQANASRVSRDTEKALELIKHVLKSAPKNEQAQTILFSILRECEKPDLALEETKKYKRSSKSSMLFMIRAEALCALGRWEEAKEEVGKAMELSKNSDSKKEALSIMGRIKVKRPDLYPA